MKKQDRVSTKACFKKYKISIPGDVTRLSIAARNLC
jgi:hypothetical protein